MAKSTFVLLALAASVAASLAQFSSQDCGKAAVAHKPNRKYDGGRIVGGQEARPFSFPHQVSLQQYGQHFCGGTVIRHGPKNESSFVITAAHCLADGYGDLTVSAGAHDLERPTSSAQTVRVAKTVYHERYNPNSYMNDIAIIKLATPIKFTAAVQPACAPGASELPAANAEGTVTGWGHTEEGGSTGTSSVLNQVGAPVIKHADCARAYLSNHRMTIDEKAMLCAGFLQGGKDSCQGDSGGPYVIKNAAGNFVLHGVVSFGIGCARAGAPGVYARVTSYLPWINQQITTLSG